MTPTGARPRVESAAPGHWADATVPAAPAAARVIFGERLRLAERYAGWLAGAGIERGLLGPREVDRLWERHLLNSAVLTDLLPRGARIVDVGSGAGLPGLPIAIRRPDLRIDLVEPMRRRTDFLAEVVAALGLADEVRIVTGRADDSAVLAMVGDADWVVARAVAPLDRLVRWCLPLLAPGGWLLALKGASAADEVAQHRAHVSQSGGHVVRLRPLGEDLLDTPTWVVAVQRSPEDHRPSRGRTRSTR